ncbi:hypothetical protein J2S70_000895 [Trueperella bonasi]|uniref:Uncharacterized protein n=1 Tax=Trueperella bonasi TaxID=312286 RepID=A0ABT9NHN7_9ACTO|nr:hypothetical protein [Trueperella bonasi]MDP9806313.1 hypothetical protein [Trueperella bonasi]
MAQVHTSRFSRVMAIIRLVVLTVIAVALVKFAFFPSQDTAEGPDLDPTFDIPQMTTFPETSTISNSIDLKGSIQADPSIDAKSPSEGVVDTIFVDNGVRVEAGQDLVELKIEMPSEDREITDEEGNVTFVAGQPWYKYVRVKAPTAGTVEMDVMRGQS